MLTPGCLRLLIGVESREDIGGDIAVWIRNHRIWRRLRCAGGHRSLVLRAHLHAAVARLGRRLRNRNGLRESSRREACAGCGDQQRQSVTQPAVGVSLCHQVFRISIRRVVPLATILSRFRPKAISFFRENNASRPDFGGRIFFLDQNFAFAGMIRLSNDAFEFHPLHH